MIDYPQLPQLPPDVLALLVPARAALREEVRHGVILTMGPKVVQVGKAGARAAGGGGYEIGFTRIADEVFGSQLLAEFEQLKADQRAQRRQPAPPPPVVVETDDDDDDDDDDDEPCYECGCAQGCDCGDCDDCDPGEDACSNDDHCSCGCECRGTGCGRFDS